jgi:hypothetical protein
MTERKKLVLHIGTHKTGTTYLQNVFAKNSDLLLKHGILYPKSGQIHNAHFKLCWQLRDPQYKDVALETMPEWRKLIDEVNTSPARVAIVSSEEFAFSIDPTLLASLKQHFDVQIICLVRSPDAFVQSFYNQFVKDFVTREARTLTTYLAEENPFFLSNRFMLEKWMGVVGRAAMTVCSFERCTKSGELFGAFMKELGLPKVDGLQNPGTEILQKVSLPPDALEYLRLSNPYLEDEGGHHAYVVDVVRAVTANPEAFSTTSSGMLSLKSRQMLRNRYAPQNTWMAKTFWDQTANPFPAKDAAPLPADFDTRPEVADARTMGRVSAMIRNLMKP